jgi:hypothetical protein
MIPSEAKPSPNGQGVENIQCWWCREWEFSLSLPGLYPGTIQCRREPVEVMYIDTQKLQSQIKLLDGAAT